MDGSLHLTWLIKFGCQGDSTKNELGEPDLVMSCKQVCSITLSMEGVPALASR